jgi:hypothetical protein
VPHPYKEKGQLFLLREALPIFNANLGMHTKLLLSQRFMLKLFPEGGVFIITSSVAVNLTSAHIRHEVDSALRARQ